MPPEESEDARRQADGNTLETGPMGAAETPKGVGPSGKQNQGTRTATSLHTNNEATPGPGVDARLDDTAGALETVHNGGGNNGAKQATSAPRQGVKGPMDEANVVPETKNDEVLSQVPSDSNGEKKASVRQRGRKAKPVALSDTEDDGTEDEGRVLPDSEQTVADLFTFKTLYKGYRLRLEKRHARLAAAQGIEPDDQGHMLVRSLADYLRVLEDRVGKLEKQQTEPASTKPAESKKDGRVGGLSHDDDQVFTSFHDYSQEETLIFAGTPAGHEGPFIKEEESFTNPDPQYVLRVLFKWNGKHDSQKSHDILIPPDPDQIEVFGIRINSEPIASFLTKQVGCKLDCLSVTQLSKPFRILIRHVAAIRNQLDILESKHGAVTSKRASPVMNASDLQDAAVDETATPKGQDLQTEEPETAGLPMKGPAEPPYESKMALLHFRELIAFLDKYLGHKIRLFTDFRMGIPVTVAFEDLWMLFESGDIVLCLRRRAGEEIYAGNRSDEAHHSIQRHVPQAYRVISNVGGLQRNRGFFPSASSADSLDQAAREANESTGTAIRRLLDFIEEQQSVVKARDRFTPLQVYCHFVDYNGTRLSLVPEIFEIKPFDGEVEVTSLSVFPMPYQRLLGPYERSLDLRSRGLRFLEYTRVTHLDYDGLTVGETQEELTSPVMVDFALAFKENPELVPASFGDDAPFWGGYCSQMHGTNEIATSICEHSTTTCCLVDKYLEQERLRCSPMVSRLRTWLEELELGGDMQIKNLQDQMSDNNLAVLLPGVVHGFSLHSRKWLQFDMRYLKEAKIAEGDSGWDDLVLPDTHRTMVQSMVETHTAGSRQAPSSTYSESKYDMGLVQGKGKGCIILLHGVPGVGKTSTAECVAAYTRRPLFPITCGDIGYEPVEVEEKLEKLFRLAHKWGCVLLIDEADVFLAERDKADVKRNGLVSVFLRVLEYYSGILFLTTNRVGAFDEAFRSRIHLSLYYPKLNPKQSYEVWRMNMRRIDKLNAQREKDGLRRVAYKKKKILDWAQLNYKVLSWNGRQIQNAFQTALALAEFEVRDEPFEKRQPTITMEHFQTIGGATIEFDNYLVETYLGADASAAAKKKQIRADEFKMEAKATVPDRELQIPVSRKPKSKSKRRKAESSSSESESSETSSESSSEDGSAGSGEAEESEVDDKTKKKGKRAGSKTKGKGTGKAWAKLKGAKGKKAKEDEDSDESNDEPEDDVTDDEKAKKKKTKKASSKKKSNKAKGKRKQSSEDEDSGETDSDGERARAGK